jgi:hypothetical protein
MLQVAMAGEEVQEQAHTLAALLNQIHDVSRVL